MAIQKIQPSYKFNEEQLKQLRQIAPEAFKDNAVDFNSLYEALADSIEDDTLDSEHYGLNWPGKRNAKKALTIPPKATLIPLRGVGVNEAYTKNIFIEGENLEVLKLLQKAYGRQVKVIYIDPPYNTGEDFIYDDDFSETLDEYLRRTGQLSETGLKLTTNTKASGRYHSKWLSMMFPRIKLGYNLLKDDGIMLVSIDDNEVHNLKALLAEIFGEENFVAQIIWNLRSGSQAGHFTKSHEYILAFAKNKESLSYFKDKNGGSIKHGALKKISKANPASDITFPAGIEFEGKDAIFEGEIGGSEKQYIKGKMIFKDGKLSSPVTINSGWAMRNQVLSWIDGKETFDSKGQKVTRFYFNRSGILWYEKERGTIHPKTVLPETVGNTSTGSEELDALFGKRLFDFPKPSSLVTFLLENILTSDDDIVMDFFSGSGTTGHACFNLFKSDIIKPKFILVQIPEFLSDKSDTGKIALSLGYKKLSDIPIDRLKKVCSEIADSDNQTSEYFGFNVYKLAPSNFKKWKNFSGTDTKQLETLFSQFESSLINDWKPENLLTEILLIEGFPLDSKIEAVEAFKKNKVQKVTSDFCEHALFVCLDKKVEDETIKALSLGDNDIFICLDNAVTDQDKARLDDKGLIKTI